MKILVVGIYYPPELTGIAKYSGEMVQWLALKGHSVQVITTPPFYPEWKIAKPYRAGRYSLERDGGVTVYRCPVYVPKKLTALSRIIHFLSFSLSSLPIFLKVLFWRPDIVVNPVPPLLVSPWCGLVAKLSGAKSILHIQDFEVDAMLGLGLASNGFIARFAKFFEKWIFRRFDYVSTISTSMVEKALSKGVAPDRMLFFPNWSDVSKFEGAAESQELIQQLGVPFKKKVILYSGNIGDKQGLEIVLEAAAILAGKDYHFLIVGDGAGKQRLQFEANNRCLLNITFAPLQPLSLLPGLLASADCHLVIQKSGVADLVMPSKVTNILAVGGNAVITAEVGTELGKMCQNYPGIATLVPPENASELVVGIELALDEVKPNRVAIKYAKKNIDKEEVLRTFFDRFTF